MSKDQLLDRAASVQLMIIIGLLNFGYFQAEFESRVAWDEARDQFGNPEEEERSPLETGARGLVKK
jgi:hypothetical protein